MTRLRAETDILQNISLSQIHFFDLYGVDRRKKDTLPGHIFSFKGLQ